jgi:hypothetical protein
MWNKFESDDSTPKDRRLLLITQRSGTAGLLDMDVRDLVVGRWNEYLWGFVIAHEPNQPPASSRLIVHYWSELPELPPSVKLRDLDGLRK